MRRIARTVAVGFLARVWLARFCAVMLLCGIWAVATPLFAGPDEPSHLVKAASVVRGELLPDRVEGTRYQFVSVPERLDAANQAASCLAFHPDQDAACIDYRGSDERVQVPTLVGRYPPVPYALLGLPTLASTGVGSVYLTRLLVAALTAACLASSLDDLDHVGRAARVGLVVAVSPMVLFLSGTINPNAAEVALAILVWTSGLRLLRVAQSGRVPSALVRRFGVAAIGLTLCRPLSPLWLAIIGTVLLVASGTPDAVRALARSRAARMWSVPIVAASFAQTAWVLLVRPVYGDESSSTDWTATEALRESIGRLSNHLREMIGVFGWLDTPAPELTRLSWTALVGLLLVLGLSLGKRREVAAIALALACCVVVPVVIEASQATELGVSWQGRYTLPIACGLLILCGVAVDGSGLSLPDRGRRLTIVVLAVAGIAHMVAFYQLLRRYSVGANGRLLYVFGQRWSPPVPVLLLLLGYAVSLVLGAFTLGVVSPSPAGGDGGVESPAL